MDWLASEEGYKAAVEVEKARERLLANVKSGKARGFGPIYILELGRLPEATRIQRRKHYDYQNHLRGEFQKLWLRATCNEMYHSLSREIRDMIYEYLNAGVEVVGSIITSPSKDPGGMEWFLWYEWKSSHVVHTKENFLGRDVFHELTENFYRNPPVHNKLISRGRMQDYLTRDKWSLGIRPADHIRVLKLEVPELELDAPALHRNLTSLSQLKQGAHIFLTLTTDCSLDYSDDYDICRRLLVHWDELPFYRRSRHSMAQYFKCLRPVCHALRNIKDSDIKLTLIFMTDSKHGDLGIIFHAPHTTIEFSVEAWMKIVMERRLEHIKNRLICECRLDEPELDESEDTNGEDTSGEDEVDDEEEEG